MNTTNINFNEVDNNHKDYINKLNEKMNGDCLELTKFVKQFISNPKNIDTISYIDKDTRKPYNTDCIEFKNLLKDINKLNYVSIKSDGSPYKIISYNYKNKIHYSLID